MKRIHIYFLPLIFLLLTAEQCAESRDSQLQDTILEQRMKGIRTHFESEFLSESALFEYEKSAQQKLSDLTDLLKILGDSSQEQSFREKAGEMILKSFVSGNCSVHFISDPGSEDNLTSVGSVIRSGLANHISFGSLVIDSLKTERPFARIGETSYQTSIGFIQHSDSDASGIRNFRKSRNEIEVIINKEVKYLGGDSLWVWALHFGNMK